MLFTNKTADNWGKNPSDYGNRPILTGMFTPVCLIILCNYNMPYATKGQGYK